MTVVSARRRSPVGAGTAALACMLGLLWVAAIAVAPAGAHAALLETSPADRAQVDTAPDAVLFTFSEPVAVPSDGLRVFDADARRVDTGILDAGALVPGPAERVGVGLPADLADGGYVAVYRVISTDSHPIAGVVTFTVGVATEVDDATVAEVFGGDGRGGPVAVLAGVLRALAYAATLSAAGAAAFAWLVAGRVQERARALGIGHRAAVVAVAVSVAALPVQAMVVGGAGLARALSPTVLAEVLVSSFGTGVVVRVAALAVLLAVWRSASGPLVGPVLFGAAAAASFALDGHQRTVEPTLLLAGADVVHLLAGAIWFGGVVVLASLVRRPVDDDPGALAQQVRRFSGVALVSVAVLGAAGVAMAVPLVATPAALRTTGYGVTLLMKSALVVVVLGVAAYNRRVLVPAVTPALVPAGGGEPPADRAVDGGGDAGAWPRLRRTLAVEASVLVLVFGVTGFLVSQRPAADAAGLRGIYETSVPLGEDLTVDLVVDPNRVGRNQVHVYVLDRTGRPSAQVDDLVLEFTYAPQGIGPIRLEPFFAGQGHWVGNTDVFAFAGDWEVRIVAGVDRFSEASATVTVPVPG